MNVILKRHRLSWAAVLCVGTFGLYLHTMGPTLVPYRDAGEIATTVTRLGVLHPPGYPLYTLVGHLFSRFPVANPAYRLNLLSAVAMALTWGMLFLMVSEMWGELVGLLTILLACVSFQFWIHALVSEMYSLNLLVLSAILWLLHRRRFDLAAFVFGVGLGVRMDLMLCAPAFCAWVIASQNTEQKSLRDVLRWSLFFFMGVSVFLYLWIRANGQPLMNWGDPSTFDRFWASLVRRSYAGTLDLLSQSYRLGENFIAEFQLYVRHLGRDFSLLSFPLALAGLWSLWRLQRGRCFVVVLGWLFTAPVFIFLANLPPNPHAVAIMEASYLTPDIFYLLALAAGIAALQRWRWLSVGVGVVLGGVVVVQAERFYPAVSKRNNWIAADFIRNVFYSVPEPSLIVARSDVPIFALFNGPIPSRP